MAHDIGFVDNTGSEGFAHWQMLLKIKTLAEANGWTTLRYLNPIDGSNRELILKGVGLSGDQEIFIGFRAYHSVSADYYNLSCAGFTGYVAGNTFDTQPGYFEAGIPAHNLRIDYWLLANAQRVAFGMKVGTPVYEHGYAGYCLPYATPGQFPYPLYIGGMLNGPAATRYSDTAHSFYARGSRANGRMRFVDGTWKQVATHPWCNTYLAGPLTSGNFQFRDTNANYPLLPVQLLDTAQNVYGALDGVYAMSGFNDITENTLTIGGKDYIVLQDVARTGFNDYLALEMD